MRMKGRKTPTALIETSPCNKSLDVSDFSMATESVQLNRELSTKDVVETHIEEEYLVSLEDHNMMAQGGEYSDYQISSCEESAGRVGTQQMGQSFISHSWTPTPEEKQQLKMHGQVWKQGVWSKEETEQLKQNILDYCDKLSIKNPCEIIFESGKEKRKNFYKTIAKGIHRPLFAIYRRVVRMYDSKNHIGKYSVEELKQLQELRKQHGNDWQKIGLAMGRSAASIKDRCRHLKEDCNAGPWTVEEEDLLSEAVFALTQSLPGENSVVGIPWIQIAQRVGSRSERQCRKKWLSYCTLKRLGTVEWNSEDEICLLRKLIESKCSNDKEIPWADWAQNWPRSSVRSYQWLRAKWRRLKSTVKDCDSSDVQDICNRLMSQSNVAGIQHINDNSPVNSHTGRTESILSVIGIVPAISSSVPNSINFSIGVGQSPVILASPCLTNIPMYLCTSNSSDECHTILSDSDDHNTRFASSAAQVRGSGHEAVVHLDLDGGEEPAVTTDVMFSGSSLCSHGSPLGFVDKGDHDSEHSHASK